jgi:hypothetical protein
VTGHDVACNEDGNTAIAMGCLLSCIVENVHRSAAICDGWWRVLFCVSSVIRTNSYVGMWTLKGTVNGNQ